jgi:hypothetical protein
MPLWQSMQVFSPANGKRRCATEARGDCLVMSMESASLPLRHSGEIVGSDGSDDIDEDFDR